MNLRKELHYSKFFKDFSRTKISNICVKFLPKRYVCPLKSFFARTFLSNVLYSVRYLYSTVKNFNEISIMVVYGFIDAEKASNGQILILKKK